MEARRSWAGHSRARLDVGDRSRQGSGGHPSRFPEAELVQNGGPSAKLPEAEIVGGPSSRAAESRRRPEFIGGHPKAALIVIGAEAEIVGGPFPV